MKVTLSVALTLLIVFVGVAYQYRYNLERARIEQSVTGFYRRYLGREPDPNGLRHWVRWAQDRWGIEKVEREGFVEVAKRGER